MSNTPSSDPIFIVGQNISANKAYYAEERGALVKVTPSVFIDARLPPEDQREVILRHAVRIALRRFPQGILAGSSAFYNAPVGKQLLLATPRGGKSVDILGVFNIHLTKSDLDLGLNGEVEYATVHDSFGELPIKRVSPSLLILKNFHPVKGRPDETYLNNLDLLKLVSQEIKGYGSYDAFMHRMEGLARAHGLEKFLPALHKFASGIETVVPDVVPLATYNVFWHQEKVAQLNSNGHNWFFSYPPSVGLQLSVNEAKGRGGTPSFLGSLLPEVGHRIGQTLEENLDLVQYGHRYISNITILPEKTDIAVIDDILQGHLKNHVAGVLSFTGKMGEDLKAALQDEASLASIVGHAEQPRISGMQGKIAGHLDREGVLRPAIGRAFTHFIKFVGQDEKYRSMCSMEWYSLVLAKLCNIRTEMFAIADLGGHGPSLIVERFDVRHDLNDKRLLLGEDFWSVAGLENPKDKYKGELMDVADTLVKHSSDLATDGRQLLRQAVFSWVTWNGDMHLKNLMLLKEARDIRKGFTRVTLSPAYDLMCTQVYPNDAKSSAIGLCGSRNHTLAGFRKLGDKLGIPAEEVDQIVDEISVNVPLYARKVADNLPEAVRNHPLSVEHIAKARDLFDVRCMMMVAEIDAVRAQQAAGVDDAVGSFSLDDDGEGAGGPAAAAAAVSEHVEAERRRSHRP